MLTRLLFRTGWFLPSLFCKKGGLENFPGQARFFVNESSVSPSSSIFPYTISVPQEICAEIDVLCPALIGFTGSSKETDTSLFAFNR